MAMKATECTVARREPVSGSPEKLQSPREEPRASVQSGERSPDELVMILVPMVTFSAMEELAKKHGGSVAQVMSVALKLLEEKSKEDEDGA